MKTAKLFDYLLSGVLRFVLAAFLFQPFAARASLEQTFDVLQIGTATYRNVTVTTKNKNYIFILHSKGMTNIKVADLPAEVRASLGYADPAAGQVKTNTPAAWARQTLSKMEVPQVKNFEQQLSGIWRPGQSTQTLNLPQLNKNVLIILSLALVGLYLLHCYCCMLICKKAGSDPGPLIWLPILQLIPLLKAASMSPWWLLGFLVPGLNFVAQIFWCVKITHARGKTWLVALLLIFPPSSPLAVLYLALSGGGSARKDDRRVEVMTLEAV